ncbi:MAG: PQQ-binding-like beta-propeller repeat protein [Alphaproteobacteria bacterium GM7ARS4]|nr:PQQ-binding-like beta-propeller repeat protein [Alphaproteobacteria bacterium GM7ARS4]
MLALSACADDAVRLQGQRIDILTQGLASKTIDVMPSKQGTVTLPAMKRNKLWPQKGFTASRRGDHLFWHRDYEVLWKRDISDGDAHTLTSPPVVARESVFVTDEYANVTAFKASNGETLWTRELLDDADHVGISGGIAYSNNILYVTTGFFSIFALDATTGETLWTSMVSTPARAAPTVIGDTLLILTIDNQLIALNKKNGQLLWSHLGIVEDIAMLGSATPSANSTIAVAAYSSGEVFALKLSNGAEFWNDTLVHQQQEGKALPVSDIIASPVIGDNAVYVVSANGNMVAFDVRSGNRLWERAIPSNQTPWLSGDYLFTIIGNTKIAAIDKKDGHAVWVKSLPSTLNNDPDQEVHWHGPLVVSHSVLIMSSYGSIRRYHAADGRSYREENLLYEPLFLPPVVSNGVLYVLTGEGTLAAIR